LHGRQFVLGLSDFGLELLNVCGGFWEKLGVLVLLFALLFQLGNALAVLLDFEGERLVVGLGKREGGCEVTGLLLERCEGGAKRLQLRLALCLEVLLLPLGINICVGLSLLCSDLPLLHHSLMREHRLMHERTPCVCQAEPFFIEDIG
jgi:hypothetical protein